jgi:hypothetical protein
MTFRRLVSDPPVGVPAGPQRDPKGLTGGVALPLLARQSNHHESWRLCSSAALWLFTSAGLAQGCVRGELFLLLPVRRSSGQPQSRRRYLDDHRLFAGFGRDAALVS